MSFFDLAKTKETRRGNLSAIVNITTTYAMYRYAIKSLRKQTFF